MSGEVSVSGRARPVSGGLWTLFSWLRRGDHSSCDSLSSVGSARTAASFAFLSPGHYATAAPLPLPPPSPPTDSYRKRVRERNQRRQTDRDITLHRKYGLYGYDAFSLPNVRRSAKDLSVDRSERGRRATSESFPRRSHVPGKRRAPLPPVTTSLNRRRRGRKRPAPLPPVLQTPSENKVVISMNSQRTGSDSTTSNSVINLGCKSEKYSKTDVPTKDPKPNNEKSFFKQIFENKKRHSSASTENSSLKLLPNISELDKQAAEIIEKYKLKELDPSNNRFKTTNDSPGSSHTQVESWICTRCLRKYDSTVVTCLHCLPLPKTFRAETGKTNNFTQTNGSKPIKKYGDEDLTDKEKLKEMLKEIKNSLPKKDTHVTNTLTKNISKDIQTSKERVKPVEAPTLRIGSPSRDKRNAVINVPLQQSNQNSALLNNTTDAPLATINNVIISQPVILEHTPKNIIKVKEHENEINIKSVIHQTKIDKNCAQENTNQSKNTPKINSKLHTPLKISSLLNPIYIPKSESSQLNLGKINSSSATTSNNNPTASTSGVNLKLEQNNKEQDKVTISNNKKPSKSPERNNDANTSLVKNIILENLDKHSRRRDLINQLERSIASGDERAAAEAAVKLAQLKLSCSVLSFSSQIISEPVSRTSENVHDKNCIETTANTNNSSAGISKKLPANDISKGKNIPSSSKSTNTNVNDIVKASPSSDIKTKYKSCNKENNQPSTSTASTSTSIQNEKDVAILIWIEDKEATRGPLQLHVKRNATMGELRKQTEESLGLASRLQRWIVGRTLCSDDNTPLITLAGPDMSAPFYLCLVETDSKKEIKSKADTGNVYNELMMLEQMPLISNNESFECGVCMEECTPGNGVVLRECVHSFCKECLCDVIRHCEEPAVSCPATACRGVLQEREIRELVSPDDYEKWLARGLAVAESGTKNAFHCRTRDCTGWALCDPGVTTFPCPVCKKSNCIPCQAIHEGKSCEEHSEQQKAAENDGASQTDEGTRTLLNTMISRGEALECPECKAIITKKWGCDWIKCSACKTEICWVTRGRRWGPGGRGDTSAGCRCGVDGKKCHPTCGYCH